MSKVSVLIPARNERFLPQTVDDLFAKAAGEIEVIVTLDGYWPDPILADRPNLVLIHNSAPKGMRAAINAAAAVARGDYLMKTDAHCLFAEGFDEVLKADCDQDWVVIPSRYSLDYEEWKIADTGRARVDYHYLSCPLSNPTYSFHGDVWNGRASARRDKPEYQIDDEMSFQGSCWFMHRAYFWDFLGGMDERGYGTFIQEPQEIGMKTWLGGGRLVVNKNTFYAHLHKGKVFGRGYPLSKSESERGWKFSAAYWTSDVWEKRAHDFAWLVERFWPVPTWPADWQAQIEARRDEIRGYLA